MRKLKIRKLCNLINIRSPVFLPLDYNDTCVDRQWIFFSMWKYQSKWKTKNRSNVKITQSIDKNFSYIRDKYQYPSDLLLFSMSQIKYLTQYYFLILNIKIPKDFFNLLCNFLLCDVYNFISWKYFSISPGQYCSSLYFCHFFCDLIMSSRF